MDEPKVDISPEAVSVAAEMRSAGSRIPDLDNLEHYRKDTRDPSLANAWIDIAASWHAGGQSHNHPGISPIYVSGKVCGTCSSFTRSRKRKNRSNKSPGSSNLTVEMQFPG